MRALLYLFIRNGGFVTFVLVEALCFFLIVEFNTRQNSIWAHSMGLFGGNVMQKRQKAFDYLSLDRQRDSLARENARLQEMLANERYQRLQLIYQDSTLMKYRDSLLRADTVRRRESRPAFDFMPARVVSNAISGANNFLMLDKGSADGVEANMAVVSRNGLVGITRHVTPHFSYVMSLLHRQTKISAKIKKYNAFGSLIWEGGDPEIMTLRYIPKHFIIEPGDTIVTSGFSQMFPKGLMIGRVEEKPKPDGENPYFLIVSVRLSQDMTTVEDVYAVKNRYAAEMDSLKQQFVHEQ